MIFYVRSARPYFRYFRYCTYTGLPVLLYCCFYVAILIIQYFWFHVFAPLLHTVSHFLAQSILAIIFSSIILFHSEPQSVHGIWKSSALSLQILVNNKNGSKLIFVAKFSFYNRGFDFGSASRRIISLCFTSPRDK